MILFGYVKPLASELKVKEYELYKALYCGLCRKGGKSISRLTRFFLSYDFACLAALRFSLSGEAPQIEKKRCPYGIKRKSVLKGDAVFEYTAAAFALLTYCKAIDDIEDSKGVKRFFKRLSLPVFKRMRKKAQRLYPTLYEGIKASLDALSSLEKDRRAHRVDELADCFAKTLELIASFGLEGKSAEIAIESGYHIGRFIYIIDCADDLKDDNERGAFNGLICHYGSCDEAKAAMPEIDETLLMSMARFERAVSLINEGHSGCFGSILQNIAALGSDKVINDIFNKYGYTRKE